MGRRDPLWTLMVVAFLVIATDLTTKAIAIAGLTGGSVELSGPFFLTLFYNDALLAGTVDLNDWALRLSAMGSSLLVILAFPVCRALAEVDDASPIALGLIVGAAVANPASLVLEPSGVTDFLGVRMAGGVSMVFNLADVACYAGLAMTARTFMLLLARYRSEQQPVPRPALRMSLEREVPLSVARDGAPEPEAPLPVPVRPDLLPLVAESVPVVGPGQLPVPAAESARSHGPDANLSARGRVRQAD